MIAGLKVAEFIRQETNATRGLHLLSAIVLDVSLARNSSIVSLVNPTAYPLFSLKRDYCAEINLHASCTSCKFLTARGQSSALVSNGSNG